MFLLNAFSINMLPVGAAKVSFVDLTLEEAKARLSHGFESAVGHADTAAVFADVLGVAVPCNRTSVSIPGPRVWGMSSWSALVGQYSGPRLPDGANTLPNGAVIRWVAVLVE